MSSRIVFLAIALAVLVAVALATNYADDDEYDALLDMMEKRMDELDFELDGDEIDTVEMEKRGRFRKCRHRISGQTCVCDRKYRRKNPKYYRACAGQ
ncbi:uncharacterized protein [Diadema setosum]|uniref:uncharacterized protein n=1 Tax=Diadema setosum TaxID=31175 RepID=UPI003B3AE027